MTSSEKLVLLALADRADENSRCFPSARRLCEDTCLNLKTVRVVLASLETKGLLQDTGERVGNGVKVFQLVGVHRREDSPTVPNIGRGSEAADCDPGEGTVPKIGIGTNIGCGTEIGCATVPKNGCATLPNIGSLNLPRNLPRNRPAESAQDTLPGVAVAPSGPSPCPHQKIIDLYHEILPELPRVNRWEGARKDYLQARWRENPKRQNLDWWRRFFEALRTSDFLMGRAPPRTPDGTPFKARLAWIVKRENFIKIMDRQYHDE